MWLFYFAFWHWFLIFFPPHLLFFLSFFLYILTVALFLSSNEQSDFINMCRSLIVTSSFYICDNLWKFWIETFFFSYHQLKTIKIWLIFCLRKIYLWTRELYTIARIRTDQNFKYQRVFLKHTFINWQS